MGAWSDAIRGRCVTATWGLEVRQYGVTIALSSLSKMLSWPWLFVQVKGSPQNPRSMSPIWSTIVRSWLYVTGLPPFFFLSSSHSLLTQNSNLQSPSKADRRGCYIPKIIPTKSYLSIEWKPLRTRLELNLTQCQSYPWVLLQSYPALEGMHLKFLVARLQVSTFFNWEGGKVQGSSCRTRYGSFRQRW